MDHTNDSRITHAHKGTRAHDEQIFDEIRERYDASPKLRALLRAYAGQDAAGQELIESLLIVAAKRLAEHDFD